MKLTNLSQVLTNLRGLPIESGGTICPTCRRPVEPNQLSLKEVLVTSLDYQTADKQMTGKEKMARFRLGDRLQNNEEVTLSAEEVALLKELVANTYIGVVITGRVWNILDPDGLESPHG